MKKEEYKENWEMIRTQVLNEPPPRNGGNKRGRSKEEVKRRAIVCEAMKKSTRIRIIDNKEERENERIEYFFPTRSGLNFESRRR